MVTGPGATLARADIIRPFGQVLQFTEAQPEFRILFTKALVDLHRSTKTSSRRNL